MLLWPPRHGKSELASRKTPPFALGQNPGLDFISASATAELAGDFGRDVRNTIASQEYRALFDTRLAEDSQAKNKWHTNAGGTYYSVGIGGSILGRGAHVALIDDPFASMEDALSERQREIVWHWYTGSLYNRLMPGASIIVIGHRMHEDDLQGRLLEQQAAGGDKWTVVEFPALAVEDDILGRAPGEALWPEWYDVEALARIQRNTLPRFWSALYQQQPAPDEGTYFNREWFRWYDEKPKHVRIYGASDYAVTADGGDYTVHGICGVDPDDNLYVLDLWRGQTESDIWIDVMLDLAEAWKPLLWAGEKGQIEKSVGPFLRKRMRERKVYLALESMVSSADKPTRAQSFRARAAQGKVYLPRNAPWVSDFLTELLVFPVGKHDDQVDVASLFGRMLDKMVKGSVPPGKTPPRRRDYGFNRGTDEVDWRTV